MKRVVIISGKGGVGKSTFVQILKKYEKISNVSIIDNVLKASDILIGKQEEKTEKYRKFLSDLKTLTDEYNDSNYIYIDNKVTEFFNSENNILFIFSREPKDIEYFKNKYNALTLLIKNNHVKDITSNIADAKVFDYKYDYVIENNIDNFESEAIKFLNYLKSMI